MSDKASNNTAISPISGKSYSLGRSRSVKEINLPDCPDWELEEFFTASNWKTGKPNPVAAPIYGGLQHRAIAEQRPHHHEVIREALPPVNETMIPIEVATMLPTKAEILPHVRSAKLGQDKTDLNPVKKEETTGLPVLVGEEYTADQAKSLEDKWARMASRGVGKTRHITLEQRWRQNAESVLKAITADVEAYGVYYYNDDRDEKGGYLPHAASTLSEMLENNTNILKTMLDPPLPATKDPLHIAEWVADKFGIETYEMGHYWSRYNPSAKWGRHIFGSSKGLVAYDTGYIYERVPKELLERTLQKQSDCDFRSADNGNIGMLGSGKVSSILKELRTLKNPYGNSGGEPFFSQDADDAIGVATTEKIPKWITINREGIKEIRDVEPEDRARFAVACRYEPEAKCPRFIQYLEESWAGVTDLEQRIQALLEFFAAAIFGFTHEKKRSLYLYGVTDSGKSVVLDLIESFFADENRTATSINDLAGRFTPAMMVNSRINIIHEVESRKAINPKAESKLKEFISGNAVQAEIKHGESFTFAPRIAFIFASNDKIPLQNKSGAVHNRLCVLQFPHIVAKEDQDERLAEKLREELSGILNLVIDAAVRVRKTGIMIDPPSSVKLKKRWDNEASSVSAWLDADCVAYPDFASSKDKKRGDKKNKTTNTATLWNAYKKWCEKGKIKPVTKGIWKDEMDGHGLAPLKRSNTANVMPVVLKSNRTPQ